LFFGVPGKMWKFGSLADFARVIHWLEKHRRKNKRKKGWVHALGKVTALIRESLDVYQVDAEKLSNALGGLLSKKRHPLTPTSIMGAIQKNGTKLIEYFDKLLRLGEDDLVKYWDKILFSGSHYRQLLKQLVMDFGNFEVILPILPPTGPEIKSDAVQDMLSGMYRINTRNLRMLEMLHTISHEWRKHPMKASSGFLKPDTNLARISTKMLAEYMLEADPVRIDIKKKKSIESGHQFAPYRFWRSAENIRLMAELDYVGPQRKPMPHRRYIDINFEAVDPVCCDIKRLEWSFREIFNNALGAVSHMYAGGSGKWSVKPLPRHATENPSAAIQLKVRSLYKGGFFSRKEYLRLEIVDEGVGIPAEHQPYITLWGYSPRRQEYEDRMKAPHTGPDEIIIGGKGIGMAYAREVMLEHGGDMYVTSKVGEGTEVVLEIPCPTPLRL